MPECQFCGKDFGNAGAKASHERSCDERPEPAQADPEPEPRQQPQQNQQRRQPQQPRQNQQAQPPAQTQQQPQQGQQGQNLPANQQQGQGQGNAIETGMQLGQMLTGAKSDDPAEKAQAKGQGLKMVGAAVAKLGETAAQRGMERAQRAKNNASRGTKKSEDFPTCVECGGQIRQVPEEEPFECPHCMTLLEFE